MSRLNFENLRNFFIDHIRNSAFVAGADVGIPICDGCVSRATAPAAPTAWKIKNKERACRGTLFLYIKVVRWCCAVFDKRKGAFLPRYERAW